MTILLTGFDPFGGDATNPSALIAQALHGQRIGGCTVVAARLPTVFGQSIAQLRQLLEQHQPAITLCLGVAAGRASLCMERIAINVNDARIADNAGQRPIDTPVAAGGPAAYFSTLPAKAMVRAMQACGLPAELSNSAGTFVCNHVMYGLLHTLATSHAQRAWRGGFMHVPALPGCAAAGLPLHTMVRGVHAALWAARLYTNDMAISGGAEH